MVCSDLLEIFFFLVSFLLCFFLVYKFAERCTNQETEREFHGINWVGKSKLLIGLYLVLNADPRNLQDVVRELW